MHKTTLTAVIDYRPFGGTCALRGCDPKKVLVGAAEAVDQARRLFNKGVQTEGLGIDWPVLMAFKRSFTEDKPSEVEKGLVSRGIDTFHGLAKFTGRNNVTIQNETLQGRYILIASGAEPMTLGIKGEENLITSDRFLELDRLPDRIIFVGGGFIAFEFAHVARRAGAEATILEQMPQVLRPFDPDLVGLLIKKSQEIGIEIRSGIAVKSVEKAGEHFLVRCSSEGQESSFEADMVVHAAGRVPSLQALNLEAAGVQQEHGRLKLNEFLQSISNPAVYAAGDAAQKGPALTPIADYDGKVAAANMLEGNRVKVDYSIVPSAVFTIPPQLQI